MTLELEWFERPDWAHAVGRDRFGLFADVSIEPRSASVAPVVFRMRWIPPGRFWMGSESAEVGHFAREAPRHLVTLTQGYWLADTPCTQALWCAVLGDEKNPSRFKTPDRPVEQVSWEEATAFLEELSSAVPGVRLPTEAEWEHACRAGTTGATYVGDLEGPDRATVLDSIAWYGANSDQGFELVNGQSTVLDVTNAGTHPVAAKAPNPWGLYDMLGNVWQWCLDGADTFEPDGYSESPRQDPLAPGAERPSRVYRGGSWFGDARRVRAAYRNANPRGHRGGDLGFRVARGRALDPAYGADAPSSGKPGRRRSRRR